MNTYRSNFTLDIIQPVRVDLKHLDPDGLPKCMETLMHITEIEEYYQTLAAEVDSRALQLSSNVCADNADIDPYTVANSFNECIYNVRSTWSWLIQASRCMEIHLTNAAQYHQFTHAAKHADVGLKALTEQLQIITEQRAIHAFLQEIKDTARRILEFQVHVEILHEQSTDIVPLHLRKDAVDGAVKAKALCAYQSKDIAVSENEDISVLDNSEVTRWKVKNGAGDEGFIPAIVCFIGGPDKKAVMAAQKVRQQLLATWTGCLSLLKQQAKHYVDNYLRVHRADQLLLLPAEARAKVLRSLRELTELLASAGGSEREAAQFRQCVDEWASVVQKLEGQQKDLKGISAELQRDWNAHKRLCVQLREFETYVGAYREAYESTRGAGHYLVTDADGNANYVSNAYIERLKPVDLDKVLPTENPVPLKNMSLAEKIPRAKEEEEDGGGEDQTDLDTGELQEFVQETEEMSQEVRETQTFVIKGVIDPRSKEEISIYQAIQEGIISQAQGLYQNPVTGDSMPIPEAMNQGLILVEFTNKQVETGELIRRGIITTTSTEESVTYAVHGVVDPVTGHKLSISEAIEKGIIDPKTGRYVNPLTGASMTFSDAIEKGLLDVQVKRRTPRNNNDDDEEDGKLVNGMKEEDSKQYLEQDLVITGVMDPRTGKVLALDEAEKMGLVDIAKGVYVDPITRELVPLEDAIKRGMLRARLADPERDATIPNVVRARLLKVNPDADNIEAMLEPQLVIALQSSADTNHNVFEKLMKDIDTDLGGIVEQISGQDMTIAEAFEAGVLHVDELSVENANGERYPLQQAAALGLVDPQTSLQLLKAIEPLSLQHMIESKQINTKNGDFMDQKARTSMPLSDAIAQGKVDPDKVFYMERPTHTIMSLSAAIHNKKWDAVDGTVTDVRSSSSASSAADSRDRDQITLQQAIDERIIEPMIDADKLAAQISSLKFLKGFMDTSTVGVKDTLRVQEVSVEDAILDDILDIPNVEYQQVAAGRVLPLQQAIAEEYVQPKIGKKIFQAMSVMALGESLIQSQLDPATGKYVHPETGRKMTLQDAIDKGFLDPNTVFLVDPKTKRVASLASYIEKGLFNPTTGKFKDPDSGKEMSMKEAIKRGLIDPLIAPDRFVEETCPLSEVLNAGKKDGVFMAPDGREYSIQDAIASGFLSPETMVKVDPNTGKIRLVAEGGMITALMDTKNSLDHLQDVEGWLGAQQVPGEVLEQVHKRIKENKALKAEVEREEPEIARTIGAAQRLLDGHRDSSTAGTQQGSQQQYQRLRFNTSDLKVRFQACIDDVQQSFCNLMKYIWVNHQLTGRLDQLHHMADELHGFHSNLAQLDDALAGVAEKVEQAKRAMAVAEDVEEVKEQFQSLSDDAFSQEDQLKAVKKFGEKYQEKSKEYVKEAEKFLGGLQQKVAAPKAASSADAPTHTIVQHIEAATDKFKGVLSDCDALMSRLSSTASKNKQYEELCRRLHAWLPRIEQEVADWGDHHDAQDPAAEDDPMQQFEELKALTSEVIAQGKLVEDVSVLGEELIAILAELDCRDSPKARQIRRTVDGVAARYTDLQQDVVDKQTRLNDSLLQSQDAVRNLDGLLEWVLETEQLFEAMKPVSLDRDALNEQIQAHRVVTSDIENRRPQIDGVVEQCGEDDVPVAQTETINELLDRYDGLISRVQERGAELEEVVGKVGALHSNVNQLEAWLANAVHSLKRESVEFDATSLKEKIERLYRQKQAKQVDLDNIKVIGKELIDDPATGDKNRLRETLADVQAKWHDLTELLVQMISFAALREIDELLKYLDKAENEINTAEPVSTDPETLAVQLRDHRAFHADLEAKRAAVSATIDKCNRMLRETTNAEADDIKNKLDTIRNQADLVCKLSSERLELLEEALPLASHFSETHADLRSWLGEIQAEIDTLQAPPDASAEQIRKQQDNAKSTQRIIEDHKPLVEDLVATGRELMDVCTEEDAAAVRDDVDAVAARYDCAKTGVRDRLNGLDDAFRSTTADVSETIDMLLEELHYLTDQVDYADSVAANPDAVKDQIAENAAIVEDLERRQGALVATKDAVARMLDDHTSGGGGSGEDSAAVATVGASSAAEKADECEELRSKLQELDALAEGIREATGARGELLQEALEAADAFWRDQQDAIRALRDIQDNIVSQDSPGVDPQTVRQQHSELEAIQAELAAARVPVEAVRRSAAALGALCGVPGRMEVHKQLDELDTALEEIEEGLSERAEELVAALDKAERYEHTLQMIQSWLPKAEDKLKHMEPIAADPRTVRIQIEEMKVFKVQVHPRYVDIQNLNQYSSDLKNASPVTAESLSPQVKEVNERWNGLLKNMAEREHDLKDEMVRLGEIEQSMDELIGFLSQTECDLQQLQYVYGDPKYVETHLKKLQLLQKDLRNQEPTIRKLNAVVGGMVERAGVKAGSNLMDKQEEMNELYRNVQIMARDKQNELQDTLKEVKGFMGDLEDLLRWMADYKGGLKTSAPLGALPETAQTQYDRFSAQYAELERKEDEVKAILLSGEDMVARCREEDTVLMRDNLQKLGKRMYDTRQKAERRKRKLDEHLVNVRDFHAMLKIHTEWLNNAEKLLVSFKYPSKLVDKVTGQIREHKSFKEDIEAHREIMQNLDRTGTYLKYFGRKQDTVYIKNLLISTKLRWKKLARRSDEKGRLLHQAFKEDKRFYDAWKGLCDWLDDSENRLKKFSNPAAAKVKQDMEELRHFQHQQTARHPHYYSSMRLGRSLKDRCIKSDPEREVLAAMLDDLKNKWNIIRSIVAQRQNKLDEALLSSGRISDAMQSLLEWLSKAEAYLAEDQPILGDLDTVNILIEQHKAFQQEVESRATMVAAIRQAPGAATAEGGAVAGGQLEQLGHMWERVTQLTDVRETRLQEALKLAEDFNAAVQVVREWLPHAESELKFRALPEDEGAIGALTASHDRFTAELRAQQPNVERIRNLSEEILQSCHPNAVRFVRYYLTITQTRWEQALQRSQQRSQRLSEALHSIRGNAALTEELLAWLSEAQALLATKEKDPIPEDLTVVEVLVREHLDFHDDLANKNKDVDKLTKLPTAPVMSEAGRRKSLSGSQWKLNQLDGSGVSDGGDRPSMRVSTLQNKWRTVWRMSVDRKKKLQDALDHLLELESFKNFDFDMWRQRYISWIRAKKFRITDFFRRQDKDGDGVLTRNEFVEGMLQSKFPTNRTELHAVFDIFDRNGSGELDYKEFVDALRPERQRGLRARQGKHPVTDNELIHDEIEQQVSHCQCRHQYRVSKMAEAKYKFGEKQKMYLVRFLNSTVMVRVGGGWLTLSEFLDNNDPCRAKGRTNTELRETFILPEGASQARTAFVPKIRPRRTSGATTPSRTSSSGMLSPPPSSSSNGRLNSTASSTGSNGSIQGSPMRRGTTPTTGPAHTSTPRQRKLSTSKSDQQFQSPRPVSSTPGRAGKTQLSSPSSTTTRGKSPGPTNGARSNGRATTPTLDRWPINGRITPSPATASGSRTPRGARTPTSTGARTPSGQRSQSPTGSGGVMRTSTSSAAAAANGKPAAGRQPTRPMKF